MAPLIRSIRELRGPSSNYGSAADVEACLPILFVPVLISPGVSFQIFRDNVYNYFSIFLFHRRPKRNTDDFSPRVRAAVFTGCFPIGTVTGRGTLRRVSCGENRSGFFLAYGSWLMLCGPGRIHTSIHLQEASPPHRYILNQNTINTCWRNDCLWSQIQ